MYLWELADELRCCEEQRPGHGLRLLRAVLVRAATLLAPRGPGDVAVAACPPRLYLPAMVAASPGRHGWHVECITEAVAPRLMPDAGLMHVSSTQRKQDATTVLRPTITSNAAGTCLTAALGAMSASASSAVNSSHSRDRANCGADECRLASARAACDVSGKKNQCVRVSIAQQSVQASVICPSLP